MTIRIFVSTEQEKRDLLEASEHIHDSNVDTDLPMVNTICHLHLAEQLITIDSGKDRSKEVEWPVFNECQEAVLQAYNGGIFSDISDIYDLELLGDPVIVSIINGLVSREEAHRRIESMIEHLSQLRTTLSIVVAP